jgi:hypothetical protein
VRLGHYGNRCCWGGGGVGDGFGRLKFSIRILCERLGRGR